MKALTFPLTAALIAAASLALAQDAPPPATPPIAPPPVVPPPSTLAPPGSRQGGDFENGNPHAPHHGHMPGLPPPSKPTRYLGVVTSPLPPVLTAQLGLPEGFGLIVQAVLPDSPAAKAGLQQYDVLTKFNDQLLVNPMQFATLVHAEKKDAEVALTFLRTAKEQKATVKLDEKMLPVPGGYPGSLPFPAERREAHGEADKENSREPVRDNMQRMLDRLRGYESKLREFQERLRDWQKNPSRDVPKPPPAPLGSPHWKSSEAKPATDGFNITYQVGTKVKLKDDKGEVEIKNQDGKRTLIAKDPGGAVIFDGPIDTEAQRKALPEDVREKLERMKMETHVTRGPGEAPRDVPPPSKAP